MEKIYTVEMENTKDKYFATLENARKYINSISGVKTMISEIDENHESKEVWEVKIGSEFIADEKIRLMIGWGSVN